MPNEPAEPRPKQGLLVLVVEDEFLTAIDLQSMLEDGLRRTRAGWHG